VKLLTSDRNDFAYTIPAFRVGRAGNVRYRNADGAIVSRRVQPGQIIRDSVRRIYSTGTTAGRFNTLDGTNGALRVPSFAGTLPEPTVPAEADSLLDGLLAFYRNDRTNSAETGDAYDLGGGAPSARTTGIGGEFEAASVGGSTLFLAGEDFFPDPAEWSIASFIKVPAGNFNVYAVGELSSDLFLLSMERSAGVGAFGAFNSSGGLSAGAAPYVFDAEWHHYALVATADGITSYVDGELFGQDFGTPNASGAFELGIWHSSETVSGQFAAAYSRALTPSEIVKLCNQGFGYDPTQPDGRGATCSVAIVLNAPVDGSEYMGVVNPGGSNWYLLTGATTVNRVTISSGVSVTTYSGADCNSLSTLVAITEGPTTVEIASDGFFRISGTAGMAYTLELTEAVDDDGDFGLSLESFIHPALFFTD
jgi:hypothetical protein